MKFIFYISVFLILLFSSCKANNTNSIVYNLKSNQVMGNSIATFGIVKDTSFVNLISIDTSFVLDMKYATTSNFLKQQVYDCQACYLRKKTVLSLIKANNEFKKMGYRIKIYDCYRPLDVQKEMWKIVSNPKYVANPATGSIHNRGGAIDITLVDANNVEIEMGTEFDFFGIEASHDFKNLPETTLENRKLLKKVLTENGFESFDSEWWHYNLKGARKLPISNFKWECE